MPIVHAYVMTALPDSADDLAEALRALASALNDVDGSDGAMVLRDGQEPTRFRFSEFWSDADARKSAADKLPQDVMSRVMSALAAPPQSETWNRLV